MANELKFKIFLITDRTKGIVLTQSHDEYLKILTLANLEGNPDDASSFKQDIEKIISFISVIKQADIPSSVEPLTHPNWCKSKTQR